MAKFLVAHIALFLGVGLAEIYTPEYCKQHPVTGPCKSYSRNYYYNATAGKCEFFVYGGCLGNFNRFATRKECKEFCKVEIRYPPKKCTQDPEVGLCMARIPRYYFNKETNRCELFYYGGCGGNSNNFRTFEDCERTCLLYFHK